MKFDRILVHLRLAFCNVMSMHLSFYSTKLNYIHENYLKYIQYLMWNKYLVVTFLLIASNCFAQENFKFQSKDDYLNYINKKI